MFYYNLHNIIKQFTRNNIEQLYDEAVANIQKV